MQENDAARDGGEVEEERRGALGSAIINAVALQVVAVRVATVLAISACGARVGVQDGRVAAPVAAEPCAQEGSKQAAPGQVNTARLITRSRIAAGGSGDTPRFPMARDRGGPMSKGL